MSTPTSPWMLSIARAAALLGVSTERLADILARADLDGETVLGLDFTRFQALLAAEIMTRLPAQRIKAALAILVARSWAAAT
ncbi:MAG: hypothetical protein IT370_16125 [Deltaproteobacteria bacterium]|nr:hypothetical protein [Deltaproteobacteria bacterium]